MLAKNLNYEYQNKKRVLHGVDFEIKEGTNIIIGPNASGKSTILKCLAGVLKTKNSIYFAGKEINRCKNLYHSLSYLPQQISINTALTIFEILLLGKIERLGWNVAENELKLVESAMKDFGIESLAEKKINEISGGQLQEVFIAQTLMKNPKYLLIDEPTNNLDLKNQLDIMEKLKNYTKAFHAQTLIVLHDLNLAVRYADCLYLVKDGRIHASGKPKDVVSDLMLQEVYGIKTSIINDADGIPCIIAKTSC